jgi:hypothetical protein
MTGIECAFTERIGQEPMLKESKAGKPWLSFSVAVGEGDDVQWLQVAAFGAKAEELAGAVKKSDRVYVEGRLKLNTWTGKDGTAQAGLSWPHGWYSPWARSGLSGRASLKPRPRPAAQRFMPRWIRSMLSMIRSRSKRAGLYNSRPL